MARCVWDMYIHSPLCSKSHDFQSVSLPRLDPLHSLQLRVDHQRPPLGISEDCSILNGHAVAGEVLVAPLSNLDSVGEERENI